MADELGSKVTLRTVVEVTDNATGEVTYKEIGARIADNTTPGAAITTQGLLELIRGYVNDNAKPPLYLRCGDGAVGCSARRHMTAKG